MWNIFIILLSCSILQISNGDSPAHILAENLDQVITSTALQWRSTDGKDKELLQNGVIAAYQIMNDDSDGENAPNSLSSKPVYVCRAKVNAIWIPGQLRPKKSVCVVSLYTTVTEIAQFDLLINLESSARLSWVHKDKYTLKPQGAVTGGEEPGYRTFVARRSTPNTNKEGSLTHFLGKFDPSDNFGVFTLVDQNNTEITYEEGEILVETEPYEYHFQNIKFDNFRMKENKKRVVLGEALLKNDGDSDQRVDTVITYKYNYTLYWGKGHGLLTGLPFTVIFSNSTEVTGNWGLEKTKEVVGVFPVEKHLLSRTACTVKLVASYAETDVPYTTIVTAKYKDKEEKQRMLFDSKREHLMKDVKLEFEPDYFLDNNTFVPTTTTTTTTSSTSTTMRSTSSSSTTQEIIPLVSPSDVYEPTYQKKKDDQLSAAKTSEENSSVPFNREAEDNNNNMHNDVLEMKKEKKSEVNDGKSMSCVVVLNYIVLVSALFINWLT